jgi:hypothetical protein
MKKSILLAASLLALNLAPVFGQPNPDVTPASAPPFQQRLQEILNRANPPQNQPPGLTKFNLDFPGGTPKELVAAIEKAMKKPLNAIIPTEDATLQMPPLKMNDVDVVQLFQAVEAASLKQETRNTSMNYYGGGLTPNYSYTTVNTGYGFKTEGQISDDSIWYFYVQNPPQPQFTPPAPAKACRFYQLRPYLDSGLTVDDITTAIQTGWKMMGDTSPPEISFHKETKLLIAVGSPDKLEIIDDVLKALQSATQNPPSPFQERLQQIIKKSSASTSDAQRLPPLTPPTPLMPPPSAKPPESPAAGQ